MVFSCGSLDLLRIWEFRWKGSKVALPIQGLKIFLEVYLAVLDLSENSDGSAAEPRFQPSFWRSLLNLPKK
jgi:hypothetical protein